MNKIQMSHGGQRSVTNEHGETQAVEQVAPDGSTFWCDLGGAHLDPQDVIDLLLPPQPQPQTLVMFFDVSGFDRDMINALVAEISAQAEANDDHPDAEVGAEIILDGDLQHAAGAVAVGAGL